MELFLLAVACVMFVGLVALGALLKASYEERDQQKVVIDIQSKTIKSQEADIQRLRERWVRHTGTRPLDEVIAEMAAKQSAETCGQPACVKDGCQKPESCEKEKGVYTATDGTKYKQLYRPEVSRTAHCDYPTGTFCTTDPLSTFAVTSLFTSTEPVSPPPPPATEPSVSVDCGSASSDYGSGCVDTGSSGSGGGDW